MVQYASHCLRERGKGDGVSIGFVILVSGRGELGLVACSEEFLVVVANVKSNPSFMFV